jgi:hypothetical protein
MTVSDLCDNLKWEEKNYGFMVAGSKFIWESAIRGTRCDKVIISRVVKTGGKPYIFGLGYAKRYVYKGLIVTHLMKRTEKDMFE